MTCALMVRKPRRNAAVPNTFGATKNGSKCVGAMKFTLESKTRAGSFPQYACRSVGNIGRGAGDIEVTDIGGPRSDIGDFDARATSAVFMVSAGVSVTR